jgi:hypothetical protein
MAAIATARGVHLLSMAGVEEDGWCLPVTSLRLRTVKPVTSGSCLIWFPGEPGAPASARFAVQADAEEPFVCEIRADTPTVVVFACDRAANTRFEVSFLCERRLRDKGSDVRDLSFKVADISFE